MRNIPISEFKLMKVPEIKDIGSFNLIADGEFLAIVVIPASAEKKMQVQNIALAGNMATGKK